MKILKAIATLTFAATIATQAAAPATTAPAPAKASGPQIEFDSLIYDFGKVSANELVKHSFTFTNTGTATLEIIDVHPGCGCTTAGSWDKKVEPGKTGIIPLQFNSAGFGGPVTKQATVVCNDPGHSNLVLQIKGTIWKPIDVQPSMAFFNLSTEAATNETKIVKVLNQTEEPLKLSDLQVNHASFKAELKTIKPDKEFEIHVTAIPPLTNSPTMGAITLKTSSTNMPTINVTAYAVVQQPVTVSPTQLTLPPGPLGGVMSLTVAVRNTGTNSLALSDAKLDIPGSEVKIQEALPGHLFNIMVSLPAGLQLKPDQKPALTIKSSHPKFPLLTVPVMQTAPIVSPVPPPTQNAAVINKTK